MVYLGVPFLGEFMRKKTTLLAGSAACLMASLISSDSSAYPTTPISYGQNPIWSAGGYVTGTNTISLETVPSGQTLVITDVHLSLGDDDSAWDCRTRWRTEVQSYGSSGTTTLASFALRQGKVNEPTPGNIISATFESGLPVPAGNTLKFYANLRGIDDCTAASERIYYTFSGYFAQS